MTLGSYINFILSLVLVLALIGISAWVYRRYFLNRVTGTRFGVPASRLGVVEVRGIDARRKLVLVRRDGIEHLLLLGPTSETLVESGITTPARAHTGDRP